jgi:tetratricopeptide (TPR) repeat protein
MPDAVTVCIFYARKDKRLKERLEEHLCSLRYRGLINTWLEKEIRAEDTGEEEVGSYPANASVVLLLVSASLLASSYWYSRVMQQTVEGSQQEEQLLVPILLRPTTLADAPLASLSFLPSNGRSITTWRNRDSAFVNVVRGIELVLRERGQSAASGNRSLRRLGAVPQPLVSAAPASFWRQPRLLLRAAGAFPGMLGGKLRREEQVYYEQALRAYNIALVRDPADTLALQGKGLALEGLKHYAQALETYRQWATLTSAALPLLKTGDILLKMKQPQEASIAYEQALARDPQEARALYGLAQALSRLGKTSEAAHVYALANQAGYED